MGKTIYVVEAVPHGDDERGVDAVFSSEEKAMEYIERQRADKDLIEALGEYDYFISQHDIDR